MKEGKKEGRKEGSHGRKPWKEAMEGSHGRKEHRAVYVMVCCRRLDGP